MKPVLGARKLHKHYHSGGSEIRALAGLDLEIHQGEFVAVMGASGSGKSTLLHLAGGLDTPTSGVIEIEGQDLARYSDHERTLFRRNRIGIVFQQFNLLPELSAVENVSLPMLVDGRRGDELRRRAEEIMRIVHLEARSGHRPQALSGGEQQRVAIARALVNDPALILADEPTGNLDSRHSVEIWELMNNLSHAHGKTIMMVTHEAQGAAYSDRICVLHDGKLLGEFSCEEKGNAALVAHRYQELTG